MLLKSGEDYLETILLIQNEKGYVRSIDIATRLSFSKPSVSRAVSNLKKDGYIEVDDKGHITFTELGKTAANRVYTRHTVILNFLVSLGVDEKTAEEDACQIEHIISSQTFHAFDDYLKNQKNG